MVKNGCYTKYIRDPTDRQAKMDSTQWHCARVRRAAEDGYMRNYGLAHFQREAKKKPPLYYYVMTHIWLTSLRKSKKERERVKRVKPGAW